MNNHDKLIREYFICPLCRCPMEVTEDGKSVKCSGDNPKNKRHSFDFSADGYLSFGATGGDSKEAVAARRSFLRSTPNYKLAAEAIYHTVKHYVPDCKLLVDAGCGEGYYTSILSDISASTVGFDLSKFACLAGSKQARRDGKQSLLFATASVFELPIRDNCADAVTNIFAPCAEEEYNRILKEGGYLFVVGAGKNHLMGLKRVMYEDVYENGSRADLPKNMEHVDRVISHYSMTISGKENIAALFSMTPYYWRTSEADKQKLAGLDSLETEIEFEINVYKK
ncbi:MAG: methyltransferase domain-containing protein [Clostridia bacterium]|nr:methyltransferase domain-containing protein [Clostridia bacterium]